LGTNRTTTWRYLQALVDTGLVREHGDGHFGLGARTVALAEAYRSQWGDLETIAGAALVRLRDRVGETAALHVLHGCSRLVLRQVESRHELHRTYRELGQPISLLAGAPSRVILAFLPSSERARYLDRAGFDARERASVEEELDRARDRGFIHTRGSRVPGVASVAAVVRGPEGSAIAAVNVTGPTHRFPEDVSAIAAEVTSAAQWVEARLAGERGAPCRSDGAAHAEAARR
jgi:DNA-binding IclR family transcriptional regulator